MPSDGGLDGPSLDPVGAQVQTTLFRALAVLRVVVATYAVVLNGLRWRDFAHPVAGWTVVAVIVGWTLLAGWAYDSPRRRGVPLLVADLAVAAATLLSTPYVQSAAMAARHASTMPSFWVVTAVLAWAVALGWRGGLPVAVLVSALDLSVRTDPNGTVVGNIFLMLLAAGIVGYSSSLIRVAGEARAEAERVAAVLAERARLARAVHDGVLQVLALVARRALDLGGESAELGRLAGEQEVALRALVQSGDTASVVRAGSAAPGASDLDAALGRLASASVTVSGPGSEVLLPAADTDELLRVVAACLDNVERHVGHGAPAWVLLERLGHRVRVTVRDAGPGIAEGRLEQAAADGRLGVAESVRGRMRSLGGTAVLTSAPGRGTEWLLELPTPVVPAPPASGRAVARNSRREAARD